MSNINIFAVGFNAKEELKSYIDKKLNKLTKVNDKIVGLDVSLKLQKSDTLQNKIVEMTLKVPGPDLFVKKQAKTFEEAVNLATNALRRQQKKHLSKLRKK